MSSDKYIHKAARFRKYPPFGHQSSAIRHYRFISAIHLRKPYSAALLFSPLLYIRYTVTSYKYLRFKSHDQTKLECMLLKPIQPGIN